MDGPNHISAEPQGFNGQQFVMVQFRTMKVKRTSNGTQARLTIRASLGLADCYFCQHRRLPHS